MKNSPQLKSVIRDLCCCKYDIINKIDFTVSCPVCNTYLRSLDLEQRLKNLNDWMGTFKTKWENRKALMYRHFIRKHLKVK